MATYSLKRNKRQKAPFGSEEAATLAAAGIQAASTITGAIMQKNAMIDAARQQARAIEQQAQIQSKVINSQTDNNNRLQERNIEFTKQQNEEARDLQKQAILNQQIMLGKENSNQRAEQAMIVARYGSNTRRKLKNAKAKIEVEKGEIVKGGYNPSTGELMFGVVDGAQGLKNPLHVLEYRPDGTAIAMVDRRLKNHGERNSDGKEGVGLAGDVKEIISKRHLPGTNFDPAEQYLATGDFDRVFNIQQNIKAIEGINDEGNKARYGKPARRRKLAGGLGSAPVDNLPYNQQPNLNTDTLTQTITGDIYLAKQAGVPNGANIDYAQLNTEDQSRTNVMAKYGKRIKLKCGGRIKAPLGKQNAWANFGGASIGSISDLIGAGLIAGGNKRASGILNTANNQAATTLINAYSKMHGIDPNLVKREDYEAPIALASIRSSRVNVNPQLRRIDRAQQRLSDNIRQNTLSSAAQQQRLSALNDDSIQQRNEIYSDQANREEQIKQSNAERLTQVDMFNAQQRAQSLKDYTQARLNLLQYNNNIENQKLQLIGEAQAGNFTSNAQNTANMLNANSAAWSGALGSIGSNFGNAMVNFAKFNNDINAASKNMDPIQRENYFKSIYGKNYKRYLSRYNFDTNPSNLLA